MSKIAEVAKAEADDAERETPAEQEEEEAAETESAPEPEPEPEPQSGPAALTEQQSEREFAKLERKASTYLEGALEIARKLEIPVQPCPLCTFPGLAIPRQANEVTSDIEGAVLALIGKGVEPEYKPATEYERCPACDGWGDVLTGAQKDISRTAMCTRCGGKGYVNVIAPGVTQQPPNGSPPPGIIPFVPAGHEPPRPEPYYDYGERQWKLPPQPIGG